MAHNEQLAHLISNPIGSPLSAASPWRLPGRPGGGICVAGFYSHAHARVTDGRMDGVVVLVVGILVLGVLCGRLSQPGLSQRRHIRIWL
jgi:hypothetical protein